MRWAAWSMVFVVFASAASAECKLYKALEMPVDMEGLRPEVAARIEGTEVKLLVDTGAFFNMLSPATARKLKLAPVENKDQVEVEGIGGISTVNLVRARDFEIGSQTFHNVLFIVAKSGGDDVLAQSRVAPQGFSRDRYCRSKTRTLSVFSPLGGVNFVVAVSVLPSLETVRVV